MKILITGGAGFIGSNFVRYWTKKYPKDDVVVLDALTYAGHKSSLENQNITFVHGDIRDANSVKKAMSNCDVVVHFAAESHVDRSVMGPEEFITTNVVGTQVLLECAREEKVSLFHHISTDEVFGHLPLEDRSLMFSKETPYNPSSPYSASKAGADHLVRAWHRTYGLPVTITNTSNNYGPYQDPEKLIPRFIIQTLHGEKVPLMGKGENIRDWIHVEDHCSAIDTIVSSALKDSKLIGQTFCVGGNSQRTNKEVTLAILHYFGKDESWIEYVDHRLGHDARYAIDSSKIKKVLKWEPQHTFEEGIIETVQWYEKHQDWWNSLLTDRPHIDAKDQVARNV